MEDHDDAFVLFVHACEQVMDDADTVEQLRGIGRRMAKEQMAGWEREHLRRVYQECLRALQIVTGGGDGSGNVAEG